MASRKSLNESGLSLSVYIPVVLFCLPLLIYPVTVAAGAEMDAVPAYGRGPHEILIFSDYLCPPCQALEPKLEPVLDELYGKGNVKVRFVDTPMHKESPLFAKYYLYAGTAAPDYKAAVRVRKVLLALAGKENAVWMDERIEEAFRKEKIAFTPFAFRTAQAEINRLIREHRVDATPTCVLVSPGAKARKYIGAGEILKGLQSARPTLGMK